MLCSSFHHIRNPQERSLQPLWVSDNIVECVEERPNATYGYNVYIAFKVHCNIYTVCKIYFVIMSRVDCTCFPAHCCRKTNA